MAQVLKLRGFSREDGYIAILQVEAQEGVLLGRPGYKSEYHRTMSIPGCGPEAAGIGVSQTHARIGWNGTAFTVEPWAGNRVAVGNLDDVIEGPTAVKDGQKLFFGPIEVRAEVIVQEERK